MTDPVSDLPTIREPTAVTPVTAYVFDYASGLLIEEITLGAADVAHDGEWLVPGNATLKKPPQVQGNQRPRWTGRAWESYTPPPAPPPSPPTADEARAECGRRILAVASIDAQLNLERHLRRLSKKVSPTAEEAADLTNGDALDAWITAMRAKWKVLVAAQDVAFRDDSKWPACPPGAAALATRY